VTGDEAIRARHVVRFDHRDRAAGVAAVDANDHGNPQDVDLPASVARGLNRVHDKNGDALRLEFF
jgi:antitoxin component of MazEF toxin-antitoxin module